MPAVASRAAAHNTSTARKKAIFFILFYFLTKDDSSLVSRPSSLVPHPSSLVPRLSFSTKRVRLPFHRYQHRKDMFVFIVQSVEIQSIQIMTLQRKFQPGLRFRRFLFSIGQLADKHGFISAFTPGLGDICANRSGRSAYLICQRILFLFRKALSDLKYLHRGLKCQLICLQFPYTADPLCLFPFVIHRLSSFRPSSLVPRPSSLVPLPSSLVPRPSSPRPSSYLASVAYLTPFRSSVR